MGAAILSDLLTEILIPVAAIIGIAFSLIQWLLVSRVKLSPERHQPSGGNKNGGLSDYLIEEEEGLNDHNVVAKCADIQNAIAEGLLRWKSDLSLSLSSDLELFSRRFLFLIADLVCYSLDRPLISFLVVFVASKSFVGNLQRWFVILGSFEVLLKIFLF